MYTHHTSNVCIHPEDIVAFTQKTPQIMDDRGWFLSDWCCAPEIYTRNAKKGAEVQSLFEAGGRGCGYKHYSIDVDSRIGIG